MRLARGGHGLKECPKRTFFVPDPPLTSRACRRRPHCYRWGRPRLPRPASPPALTRFFACAKRGDATLVPLVPPGLKPLANGLGSRRLRRRHACGLTISRTLWSGRWATGPPAVGLVASQRISISADTARHGLTSLDTHTQDVLCWSGDDIPRTLGTSRLRALQTSPGAG
jgi:hypothetical protein